MLFKNLTINNLLLLFKYDNLIFITLSFILDRNPTDINAEPVVLLGISVNQVLKFLNILVSTTKGTTPVV